MAATVAPAIAGATVAATDSPPISDPSEGFQGPLPLVGSRGQSPWPSFASPDCSGGRDDTAAVSPGESLARLWVQVSPRAEPVLWAYGLRRAGSKWPTWAWVARVPGRSVVWFPTVGSSRIAEAVARETSAWRTGGDAALSGASGRILWEYGLRRRGSKSLTGELAAGARGWRMAPGCWHCRTSGGAVVPAASRRPALRCVVATGIVAAGQGQVGSPPVDRRRPVGVALGDLVASASQNISTAEAETICIKGPGVLGKCYYHFRRSMGDVRATDRRACRATIRVPSLRQASRLFNMGKRGGLRDHGDANGVMAATEIADRLVNS